MTTSAFAVEAITLPVNGIDRALRFYVAQVGDALQERGFRQTPEQG